VAHWSGSNGGGQHLCEGEKKKKNGASEVLIAEKAGLGRGSRTSCARGVTAGIAARWQTASGDGTLPRCMTGEQGRLHVGRPCYSVSCEFFSIFFKLIQIDLIKRFLPML
jgi:hypothetical protein